MKSIAICRAAVLSMLLAAGTAQATVINFDGPELKTYAHTGWFGGPIGVSNAYYMDSYVEKGFALSLASPLGLGSLYSPDKNHAQYTGSAAMAATALSTATLRQVGGGTFSLDSIDLKQFSSWFGGTESITFFATTAANKIVKQTFEFGDAFKTFNFSSQFDAVTSVSWRGADLFGGYLFDNINVNGGAGAPDDTPPATNVPEPGTVSLVLAGLGLLGWRARRRNA